MFSLYLLTFINGKKYIGQTVRTVHLRMLQHKRSARSGSLLPVHCAWRLYGDPMVDVLAEYETAEELHVAEIAAITAMNTLCPNGYNLSLGGDTAPSKNPEVAAKISAEATGRKHADTSAWSAAVRKLWKDDDYRKKVSAGLKAGWTDDRREAVSARLKESWAKRKADGWEVSEATRQKLSERPISIEWRKKMSEAAAGKPKAPRTQETKDKLSQSVAKSWNNPEIRARRINAIKAAKSAK